MNIQEIAAAPTMGMDWQDALASLVMEKLSAEPGVVMDTGTLLAKLGAPREDRKLQGAIRSKLHAIKNDPKYDLIGLWYYSGKTGRFKDSKGERVKLLEWKY